MKKKEKIEYTDELADAIIAEFGYEKQEARLALLAFYNIIRI